MSACFLPLDGSYTSIPRGDDNSFGPVSLGFNFQLFGSIYSSLYINTNGNITFQNAESSFTAQGFPISTPMVAAFWADVDTRPAGSGLVLYKVFPDKIVITWDRVGYFSQQTDKRNTFQLVLRSNVSAPSTADDVTFAYGDMEWTTGSASGGSGGFGGAPATVGVNKGLGSNVYIETGRFDRAGVTPPSATTSGGISWLDDRCVSYAVGNVGNLPPTAIGFPANNTLVVNQGQTAMVSPRFSGPEASQTVAVAVNTNGLCNTTAVVGSGAAPTVDVAVTGAPCNVGTHTITFRATDNGSPVAAQSFTLTVVVNPPLTGGQWTGAVSTAYEAPGNWSSGAVPGGADHVVIPASAGRMPVLTTTTAAASLTVAPGASFTVAATGDLTLTQALTANGPCQGPGRVRAAGSSPQLFGGSSGLHIGQLDVGAAGLALAGPLRVQRLLVLNGNLTTAGQSLVLLSDNQGTAMVVNNGPAEVVGTATVQRYIDGSLNTSAGYRHLAAPVQNTTLADLSVSGFAPVLNSLYNTAANPGRVVPFPNVFGYNQGLVTSSGNAGTVDFDRGWFSPTAPTEFMTPGTGYTVNIGAGLTVDFVGTLTNGAVPRPGLARGPQAESGWHLLGNPYPAPIDWNLLRARATGLDDAVYVFKSGGPYNGAYAGFVNGIGVNGGTNLLALGQGFFVHVRTPGVSGQVAMDNSTRLTAYQNPVFNRPAADPRPQLTLELRNAAGAADQAVLYFEAGATPDFDARYDAYQLGGGSLGLAVPVGTKQLSISGLPALGHARITVPLTLRVAQAGAYTLRVGQLLNLPPGTTAYLHDAQTGTLTPLQPQTVYAFTTASAVNGPRFTVQFNPAEALAAAPGQLQAQVSVFPNPARHRVWLSLPATRQPVSVAVLNALGQRVFSRTLPASTGVAPQELALAGLASGVYTVRITLPEGSVAKRVILE